MRFPKLRCSMPGCKCWASTYQVFSQHMRLRHGAVVTRSELEELDRMRGVSRYIRRARAARKVAAA